MGGDFHPLWKVCCSKGRGIKYRACITSALHQPLPALCQQDHHSGSNSAASPISRPSTLQGPRGRRGAVILGGTPLPGRHSLRVWLSTPGGARHTHGRGRRWFPHLHHPVGLGTETLLVTMATFWHPASSSASAAEPGRNSRWAGSGHPGLVLGLGGNRGRAPSSLRAHGSSPVQSPSRPARSECVGSLPERCQGRQVGLPRHLRPTRRRRRAGSIEASANPGPWRCGGTNHSL